MDQSKRWDDAGESCGIATTMRELTQQQQTESLLAGQQRILAMIATGAPLADVLTDISQLVEAQSNGQVCSFLVMDEYGDHIRQVVGPSLPAELMRLLDGIPTVSPYFSPCSMALHSGQAVVVANIANDDRWSRQWCEAALANSLWCSHSAPIVAPNGTVLAAFTTYCRREYDLESLDRQLHQVAAHLASIAIGRKNDEDRLQKDHARIEAFCNTSPVGACLIDADMRIRLVNPQARPIFCGIEDVMGSDFLEAIHILWPAAVADEIASGFRHTLQSGEPHFVPESFMKRDDLEDGEYYEWQIHRISLPDGQYGAVCYFNDISRHVRARQILVKADRRKMEFLATLGHELRNPLAAIRMGLELIKMAADDPRVIAETRCMMERQTQQLIRLTDDLLEISRITEGKIGLRTCRVAITEVVQSVVEAVQPIIAKAGHELTVILPEVPVDLEADPQRLTQVLSNLLNNSIKYTPEGGRIGVSVECQGGDVVVKVTDNGIGIPSDMRDEIFEMFTQLDRPLEKGGQGLGIGLALVKQLVEMHGGSVDVRSDGINKGSEFCLRLPGLLDSRPSKPRTHCSEAMSPARLRILVVDDNRETADILSMIVRILGNEVLTAYDGAQAIEVAAEFQPDVLLMDLGMPKMNGLDVARHIRAQPWGKQTVLVALTGWGLDEDRQRTAEAGFDLHLVKPAEPAVLQKLFADLKPT